jgi:hypothetical protein
MWCSAVAQATKSNDSGANGAGRKSPSRWSISPFASCSREVETARS